MPTLIDLGEAFFVKNKITAAKKSGKTITIFLAGTPDGFDINFSTEKEADEFFDRLKKLMLTND